MLLAIDQGTTGTTCLVVDEQLRPAGRAYREIAQHFPEPGWVEHDPEELWASVRETMAVALAEAGLTAADLAGIGITNQRETTVVWERGTGRPVYPAIVWQDRRTAARCAALPEQLVRERTGLVRDPYFSATKLEWILTRTDVPQVPASAPVSPAGAARTGVALPGLPTNAQSASSRPQTVSPLIHA